MLVTVIPGTKLDIYIFSENYIGKVYHILIFIDYGMIPIHNYHKKNLQIPKGGNQIPYIEEEQTKQWPKDTKRVIRFRISKNKQHNGQKKNTKRQTTIYKTYI